MAKKDVDKNPFVALAGTILGIFLVVVIMGMIFAQDSLVFILTNAVWAFVVLGIVLGAFIYKSMVNPRKKK